MLRTELCDEGGSIYALADPPTTDNHFLPQHSIQLPFSTHYAIPIDVLQRMVKNKMELAALQRLGELAISVENILNRLSLGRPNTTPRSKVSSLITLSSDNILSSESMESRPRDTSHQPLETSHVFDSSSGQPLFDTPDHLAKNTSHGSLLSEKDILEAFVAIGNAISDMLSLRKEIERYHSINQAIADELVDVKYDDIAVQKRELARSEAFILACLDQLSSGDWNPSSELPPWQST